MKRIVNLKGRPASVKLKHEPFISKPSTILRFVYTNDLAMRFGTL